MTRKPRALRGPLRDRFESMVHRVPFHSCWEWVGPKGSDGYGVITTKDRRQARAHRVSFELSVGPIPPGMQVLHSCDNPGCVRPDHLRTGTNDDNARDKVARGRQSRGEGHYKAKLSRAAAEEIRERYALGGVTQAALAREFGVSVSCVSFAVNNRTWRSA